MKQRIEVRVMNALTYLRCYVTSQVSGVAAVAGARSIMPWYSFTAVLVFTL